MSPRPFERPATIALPEGSGLDPGSALEGLWLPARGEEGARGGAVVAPPHPLMGGSMDSPVATELGMAVSDRGFASLRFNWRGVGGSAGRPSGEREDADCDYRAALDFVEESAEGPVLACGYSWGAVAAARAALGRPRVQKLVLISPPAGMLDAEALGAADKAMLVVAGDRDEYVPIPPLEALVADRERAELIVLEDVDHFFMTGLSELGRAVRRFLEVQD